MNGTATDSVYIELELPYTLSLLTLYQPMMANAVMGSHKNLCGEFNSRCYTITQGFACLR